MPFKCEHIFGRSIAQEIIDAADLIDELYRHQQMFDDMLMDEIIKLGKILDNQPVPMYGRMDNFRFIESPDDIKPVEIDVNNKPWWRQWEKY